MGQGPRRRGRPRRLRHRRPEDALARSPWCCAPRATPPRATSTSAPATTTTAPRASTRTSACLTRDPAISHDVGELFNFLTGFSRIGNYEKIIVSPLSTRTRVVELINAQRDRGTRGKIAIKVNGLTDPTIIDALYEASIAGVEIRLDRAHALLASPGRARALGEHHRPLGRGRVPRALADLHLRPSPAKTSSRSTSVRRTSWSATSTAASRSWCRSRSRRCRQELLEAFEITWRDDLFTWVLGTDRRWRRLQSVNNFSAQAEFKRRAMDRARSLSQV